MAAVTINNFTKKFGAKKVVDDLSFEVEGGEIFAFLGSNGSGKTTTIRCLLGIFQPDEGELLVDDKSYGPQMASILGYLPEERGLYTDAKVLETLVYFGEVKGVEKNEALKRAKGYLERVELPDKAEAMIKTLSSGQQQKVQLGLAIINRPKLLILDEPTKGMDPVNRSLLMEILNELNDQGSTIVFTTHQMDEVERVANRLVMIHDGRRVLYGDLNEVKRKFGDNTVHLRFQGKVPANDQLYSLRTEKNTAELTPKDGVHREDILKELLKADLKILSFEVKAPSLEQIFIQVTKDEK